MTAIWVEADARAEAGQSAATALTTITINAVEAARAPTCLRVTGTSQSQCQA